MPKKRRYLMNSPWQFCSVKQLLRLPCMKNQKLKFKGEISETGVEFVASLINSKYTYANI